MSLVILFKVSSKVLRLKSHKQKCKRTEKHKTVAASKRPLEERVSEPETMSND